MTVRLDFYFLIPVKTPVIAPETPASPSAPETPNPEHRTPNREAVRYSGDYGKRVTPVPIPNTEVKPLRAYGTADPGGRVGRRRNSPPLCRDICNLIRLTR